MKKAELLAALREGAKVSEALEMLGGKAWQVQRWKAEDERFRRNYEEATAHRRNGMEIDRRLSSRSLDQTRPGWKDEFFAAWDRNIHRTAKAIGVSPGSVLRRINPQDPLYDVEFHEDFLELDGATIAAIEDVTQEQMLEGEIPSVAHKVLQSHPLTRDRYGDRREVTSKIEGSVTWEATVVTKTIEQRSRELAAEEKRLLESSVIEGEFDVQEEDRSQEEDREPGLRAGASGREPAGEPGADDPQPLHGPEPRAPAGGPRPAGP